MNSDYSTITINIKTNNDDRGDKSFFFINMAMMMMMMMMMMMRMRMMMRMMQGSVVGFVTGKRSVQQRGCRNFRMSVEYLICVAFLLIRQSRCRAQGDHVNKRKKKSRIFPVPIHRRREGDN